MLCPFPMVKTSSRSYNLQCIMDGEPFSKAFFVRVATTSRVSNLQSRIKTHPNVADLFKTVDVGDIKLWYVKMKHPTRLDDIARLPDPCDKEPLQSESIISDVLTTQPAGGYIDIMIKHPDTRADAGQVSPFLTKSDETSVAHENEPVLSKEPVPVSDLPASVIIIDDDGPAHAANSTEAARFSLQSKTRVDATMVDKTNHDLSSVRNSTSSSLTRDESFTQENHRSEPSDFTRINMLKKTIGKCNTDNLRLISTLANPSQQLSKDQELRLKRRILSQEDYIDFVVKRVKRSLETTDFLKE